MFALTGDDLASLLQGVDKRTWIFLGGLAALWATRLLPANLWSKALAMLPSLKKTPAHEPVNVDELADLETTKLLELLRLKTALLPAKKRESIALHCDGIEAELMGDMGS